jgi:tight adherence protein B
MNIFFIASILFLVSLLTIQLSVYAFNIIRNPDQNLVRKRLKTYSKYGYDKSAPDIVKKKVLSKIPILDVIFHYTPGIQSLEKLREQANAQYPIGFFILFALVLAQAGYVIGSLLLKINLLSYVIAGGMGLSPFVYLRLRKAQRVKKFNKQLPEGLDLIARAMRAGHAFTTGLKLAADESNEPLGLEFRKVVDEVNFGVDLHEALKSLAERMDFPDLKFFVVSVVLQRETGGNLAEILESISHLIRERYLLQGKMRTLSAEGRLSATILTILPFAILLGFTLIRGPGFIDPLFKTSEGKIIITIALSVMTFGIFWIWKIVKIKI